MHCVYEIVISVKFPSSEERNKALGKKKGKEPPLGSVGKSISVEGATCGNYCCDEEGQRGEGGGWEGQAGRPVTGRA